MVGLGNTASPCAHNGRGNASDMKTHFAQSPAKQAVLFVAPTTATAQNNLFEGVSGIRGQWHAELHVDIFERDAANMV
jgi:hypothetical protein